MAIYDVTAPPFNAVPDDPTAGAANMVAFQDALDQVKADGEPGGVFVPDGRYTMGDGTGSARLRMHSNTRLFGTHRLNSVLVQNRLPTSTGRTSDPFITNDAYKVPLGGDFNENLEIHDLGLVGMYADGYDGYYDVDKEFMAGIAVSGTRGLKVYDCRIENFHGDGVLLESAHDPTGSGTDPANFIENTGDIYDNEMIHCLRGGVTIVTCAEAQVVNNDISGPTFALHVEPGETGVFSLARNVTLERNYCHDIWSTVPTNFVTGLWMGQFNSSEDVGIINAKLIANSFERIGTKQYPSQRGSGPNEGFWQFVGVGNLYQGNSHRDCHTTGAIWFFSPGKRGQIHGNTWDDCSCTGAGSVFWRHRTWPRTMENAKTAGWSWKDNTARRIVGSADGNSAFFWPLDAAEDGNTPDRDQLGDQWVMTGNVLSCEDFFYGFRAFWGPRITARNNTLFNEGGGGRAQWKREPWPATPWAQDDIDHVRDNIYEDWPTVTWPIPTGSQAIPVGQDTGESFQAGASAGESALGEGQNG